LFFQAEDGIRDFHVTGVQTCALPIFGFAGYNALKKRAARTEADVYWRELNTAVTMNRLEDKAFPATVQALADYLDDNTTGAGQEIGRASCRERVGSQEVRPSCENKRK